LAALLAANSLPAFFGLAVNGSETDAWLTLVRLYLLTFPFTAVVTIVTIFFLLSKGQDRRAFLMPSAFGLYAGLFAFFEWLSSVLGVGGLPFLVRVQLEAANQGSNYSAWSYVGRTFSIVSIYAQYYGPRVFLAAALTGVFAGIICVRWLKRAFGG
jgi:hypothetical protein